MQTISDGLTLKKAIELIERVEQLTYIECSDILCINNGAKHGLNSYGCRLKNIQLNELGECQFRLHEDKFNQDIQK